MMKSGTRLLGPVAQRLLSAVRWTDKYPAWGDYSQELEVLLLFAESQGQLSHFVPRLESKNAQRDEALDELRIAHFLCQSGFAIKEWEPAGLNGKIGEYLVGAPEGQGIFVEVKSPGWEGELSDAERQAGRTKQPKYRNGEGGAFGNWQPLQKCIASKRTYPKFAPTQPNLLVVADDLQVSLHDSLDHVLVALYANHTGYGEVGFFTSSRFENLGGVGVFRAFGTGRGVENQFEIFDKPFALPAVKLPGSILRFQTQKKSRTLAVQI
jgi:hypothetical protein